MKFLLGSVSVLIILISGFQYFTFANERTDSLLNELSKSQSKSTIFNQLAEIAIVDSLDQSFEYARKALDAAIFEKNDIND